MSSPFHIPVESVSGENITHYSTSEIRQLTPASIDELVGIVQDARKSGVKLYPMSTGFNWGLGSKIPILKEGIVLKLSRLNSILEYSENEGTIVVEPGVTQKQIADFLKERNSTYFLDVTGSSQDTGLVGNCLERGISYNCLRAKNVLGLEVLTGEAQFIRTGGWRHAQSKIHNSFKYGIGPDLTGLFFQSNFGIVTKMIYKLQKKTREKSLVQLRFNSIEDIAKALPVISDLIEDNTIQSIFHIANGERARGAVKPYLKKIFLASGIQLKDPEIDSALKQLIHKPWVSTGVLAANDSAQLKAKMSYFQKKLKPFCEVQFISIKALNFIEKYLTFLKGFKIYNLFLATVPFQKLYFGEPTNATLGIVLPEQDFLSSTQLAASVDSSPNGFAYCLPISQMNGPACVEMLQIIQQVAKKYNFDPAITLNPILSKALEAVVSINYEPLNALNARACIREMQKQLMASGFIPYRTNIKDMDLFYLNDYQADLLQKIKSVFDPANIISPGRYILNTDESL